MDVVVALVIRDGRILAEQRSAEDAHSPGALRFPAGHVEPGESLEQALAREVREELSRAVVSSRKLREADFEGSDKLRRKLHYFRVELDAPPADAARLRWLGREDAERMDFPVDRELIRELL